MNEKLFVSFAVAGDPSMSQTKGFIETLGKHSDIVEVGLPFSDPVADGEIVQKANIRALANGATTDSMFDMLETVKLDKTKLAVFCYANSAFVYGYDKFFARCVRANVFGVIIPDLPYEERGEALPFANKHNVHLITLIDSTSKDRIAKLAKDATWFIYLISSPEATDAGTNEFSSNLKDIVEEIKAITDTPICIDFGDSTAEQIAQISKIGDGIVIGSAIALQIENSPQDLEKYAERLKSII